MLNINGLNFKIKVYKVTDWLRKYNLYVAFKNTYFYQRYRLSLSKKGKRVFRVTETIKKAA